MRHLNSRSRFGLDPRLLESILLKGGLTLIEKEWRTCNPSGSRRVVVTKELPGDRWLEILAQADCKVEICTSTDILSAEEIKTAIRDRCDGAIGQLTEEWGEELFAALKAAGGKAYSNYAVGYNNVDVDGATKQGIPVGNTPGVLTETTAEMAVALTFTAARRVVEADRFMRGGRFKGWLPTLFLGELFWHKTVGVIGAGRIGAAYARMMVEGHKMDLIYYDLYQNKALEEYIGAYGEFLKMQGEKPVSCIRAESVEELLKEADLVSLHPVLDETTHHLINRERLALMKENAILINSSRGPVIDEVALVAHCQKYPKFRVGLDVFENEPEMKPGLSELDNVVIMPHIASATVWTREGMATLAASNVAGILMGYPAWQDQDISPFIGGDRPRAAPSIVNAKELGIPLFSG
ncbi:MAG: D-glycerate dehydrogenase [Deltaproteobacteria bacterium]|nr:D-glycerate dehydrogenase [Deltaproteobacteria bacterium]